MWLWCSRHLWALQSRESGRNNRFCCFLISNLKHNYKGRCHFVSKWTVTFYVFKTKNSQKLIKDTESHHNEKICTGKFQLLNQSFNTFKNVVSILRQRYNSDNNYKTSWLHEDPTKKQHFTCLSFKIKNNIHENILLFFTGQVFGPSGITTGEKWVTIIGPQAIKRPKRFYFVIWVFCQLHMTPVSKHITIYLSDKPFHLEKAGSTHSFNYLASLHLTITVKLSVSL